MSTIAVIGATGYAGGAITREAVARGHQIIAVSRTAPTEVPTGVEVRGGSILDDALLDGVFADADVVIVAVHAVLGEGQPTLVDRTPALLDLAARQNTRLGFVGGAGSLKLSPEGPRLVDTPEFPAEYKAEAATHADVLETLRDSGAPADWFYVSPAAIYGAYAPGERTGSYRVTGDLLLLDGEGNPAAIGGEDFAIAVVDEIETPAHRGARFGVAN